MNPNRASAVRVQRAALIALIGVVTAIQSIAHASQQTLSRGTATDTLRVGSYTAPPSSGAVLVDTTELVTSRQGVQRRGIAGVTTMSSAGAIYRIVYRSPGRKGPMIDSIEVDASTLAPRRHVEAFPDSYGVYVYHDGVVDATIRDSAGVHTERAAIANGRFDYSTIEQVLSLIPRTAGYSAIIPAFDVSTRSEKLVKVRVVGDTAIGEGTSRAKATTIEADFGQWQVTYWVAPATGRPLRWYIKRGDVEMTGISRLP